MKIAVAPTVIALDVLMFHRIPKPRIVASVLVVCVGIAVATVTDTQVGGAARGGRSKGGVRGHCSGDGDRHTGGWSSKGGAQQGRCAWALQWRQ